VENRTKVVVGFQRPKTVFYFPDGVVTVPQNLFRFLQRCSEKINNILELPKIFRIFVK
jgi:hypothetical protein